MALLASCTLAYMCPHTHELVSPIYLPLYVHHSRTERRLCLWSDGLARPIWLCMWPFLLSVIFSTMSWHGELLVIKAQLKYHQHRHILEPSQFSVKSMYPSPVACKASCKQPRTGTALADRLVMYLLLWCHFHHPKQTTHRKHGHVWAHDFRKLSPRSHGFVFPGCVSSSEVVYHDRGCSPHISWEAKSKSRKRTGHDKAPRHTPIDSILPARPTLSLPSSTIAFTLGVHQGFHLFLGSELQWPDHLWRCLHSHTQQSASPIL